MTDRKLKNFTVTYDDAGVFRVALDVTGRPMNVLNHAVMTELDQIISELESRDDISLVVFKSGKESGFLAGADVEAIQGIESAEQAERLLLHGQRLFDRIERLPMVTLAVLHGPCLGGGLELALACDYRIARDNSSTKIGLPEIKLGLIPGWGGTQRLPKLVGLRNSLDMILSGKHLSAAEAVRIGLVDRAIAPEAWRDQVFGVIETLAYGYDIRRSGFGVNGWMRMIERSAVVRGILLSLTRNRLAAKSVHYPALEAAIQSIADSYRDPTDGYTTERREFVKLIGSPTSQQLIQLFLSRESARSLKTWAPKAVRTVHRDPIRKLGVIGAGAMGAGIAHVAATRGYEVCIKEVDTESAARGTRRIDDLVFRYGRHKGLSAAQRNQLRNRISLSTDFQSFEDADCVIEAVVERMETKKCVLAEVERASAKSAILATNTSALSVTEMSKSLNSASRFAGLHFFNPVHRMELVEVVRGKETSDTTIARLVSLVRALGKTPVVTTDSPGFLVNRVLFPYLGEAVLMVRQGYEVAAIDRRIRRFGMPMGPLELLDRVGLDVALHVAQTLRPVLCDADDVIEFLAPLVDQNQCGLKSKIGFYDYTGKRKTPRKVSDLVEYLLPVPQAQIFSSDGLDDIQRRLIYPMLAESVRCESESVVEHSWAIDLAMVLGTGFAPHRGGPLNVIDQIGPGTVHSNLEQLCLQLGDRFSPPEELMQRCRSGEPLT